MQYRWKAAFERIDVQLTEDGEVVNNQTFRKFGEMSAQTGQSVAEAVLESHRSTGNLVYLEVQRV
jgi:hypothetical protein